MLQLADGPAALLPARFRGINGCSRPDPEHRWTTCSSVVLYAGQSDPEMLQRKFRSPSAWLKPEGDGAGGQVFVCRLQIHKQTGLGLPP